MSYRPLGELRIYDFRHSKENRAEFFKECSCKYTKTESKPGIGGKDMSRCQSKGTLTQICTREKGHSGKHHSHIAKNRIYKEWK